MFVLCYLLSILGFVATWAYGVIARAYRTGADPAFGSLGNFLCFLFLVCFINLMAMNYAKGHLSLSTKQGLLASFLFGGAVGGLVMPLLMV
ncbi:hypothetical protein A4E84_22270 [Streptomyces qaidamensis]|uniref:Uncharacterized protein n=1 Tax=Streptomyces qaidamensis TaxID=1783515 RepID=A0A143C3P3_9ACTN|nr:hypothetical protein A4E84_22270 [Streptomyces qaidamensis]